MAVPGGGGAGRGCGAGVTSGCTGGGGGGRQRLWCGIDRRLDQGGVAGKADHRVHCEIPDKQLDELINITMKAHLSNPSKI